ncbi:polysaccharide pyruvyl transferase family protein [Pseudidiomarina sp. 1APR75-33.1]|uniref:polysaccharide pyruvyl transferase family protein n=1 Tax=Pseudidiomarina terrestris TaxID=2820060 RepID=UPI00264F7802|nr:polysaccharide pyruvyl transferase family protein [Pseudidiomarina sp. 1APR75-33.1]MDN7126968.1 polysaccharide pyruvyl transferase family protein [Pseudidiomarina sp. 1APR75-33.1]
MLNVEVKGISFANKGAELMLHAIIAQFAERGVDARFVVEPTGPYDRRAAFGLWQKSRYIRKRMNLLAPVSWLPQRLRHMFGILNENELDLILDASGFAFGDQWSHLIAWDRLGSSTARLRQQGIPVIVLPQALGPFTEAASAKAFAPVLEHANLVYARDDQSLSFCQQLSKDTSNLKRCPDFTNLIKGLPAAEFDSEQHQTCFIPNSKMLEKRKDGDRYVDFMVAAIRAAQDAEAKPFILIHEADADRRLTAKIQAQLATPVPVLDPGHALKIKWIIGQSRSVISSRFHGLVSALSQGVPVLATGWSHKYHELLADYGCAGQLIDIADGHSDALQALQRLMSDNELHQQLQATIVAQGQWQREAVTQMWNEVFAQLPDQGKA